MIGHSIRAHCRDGSQTDHISGKCIFHWAIAMPSAKATKKMLYLMTHSTHFNLRTHDFRHVVKDNSVSDRRNSLPPLHGLLFLSSKASFTCTIPIFYVHWLSVKWLNGSPKWDPSADPQHHEWTLYHWATTCVSNLRKSESCTYTRFSS